MEQPEWISSPEMSVIYQKILRRRRTQRIQAMYFITTSIIGFPTILFILITAPFFSKGASVWSYLFLVAMLVGMLFMLFSGRKSLRRSKRPITMEEVEWHRQQERESLLQGAQGAIPVSLPRSIVITLIILACLGVVTCLGFLIFSFFASPRSWVGILIAILMLCFASFFLLRVLIPDLVFHRQIAENLAAGQHQELSNRLRSGEPIEEESPEDT